MICEECKEKHFRKVLAGADKAIKRYTKKIKEERICRIQVSKKGTGSKEK